MIKRPYRQGQTLWMAWTQANVKGETEVVVKPLFIVSCLLTSSTFDDESETQEWLTIVRFYWMTDQKSGPRPVETSIDGIVTHKTRRQAQRTVDEWNRDWQAQREQQRLAREAELQFGTIQETF